MTDAKKRRKNLAVIPKERPQKLRRIILLATRRERVVGRRCRRCSLYVRSLTRPPTEANNLSPSRMDSSRLPLPFSFSLLDFCSLFSLLDFRSQHSPNATESFPLRKTSRPHPRAASSLPSSLVLSSSLRLIFSVCLFFRETLSCHVHPFPLPFQPSQLTIFHSPFSLSLLQSPGKVFIGKFSTLGLPSRQNEDEPKKIKEGSLCLFKHRVDSRNYTYKKSHEGTEHFRFYGNEFSKREEAKAMAW